MFKKIGNTVIMDDDWLRLSKLDPGVYRMTSMMQGPMNRVFGVDPHTQTENLIEFKHDGIETTVDKIKHFAGSHDKYTSMGFCHKTGVLWYGKAGTGKTSAARLLMNRLTKEFGAVCIDATGYDPGPMVHLAQHIRGAQDNMIVLFVDECERMLNDKHMLSFLDGSRSIQNLVFIGCTNYLDRVPSRIKNRPSRIRYVIEVSKIPLEMYSSFITSKCPSWEKEQVDKMAYLCSDADLTMDQLKNAVIELEIFGATMEKAIKSMRKLSAKEDVVEEEHEEEEDLPFK